MPPARAGCERAKLVIALAPWVDLTQPLYDGMPTPQYFPKADFTIVFPLTDEKPQVTQFTLCTHMGTHVDAPSHFIRGGKSIDELPLCRFMLEGSVVAVEAQAGEAISLEMLEAAGAKPRRGDALLIATGWDRHWQDGHYYEHPYLADAVATWLVERGVTLLGVDIMSPDLPIALRPKSGFGYPIHRTLLGNDVLIMENLFGLRPLAGQRIELNALPLPVRAGDGAPARVVARVLDKTQ